MLIPLLLLGAAVVAQWGVSGAATKVVLGAELLGGRAAKKKNKQHEENNRLGLNPEHALFTAARQKEIADRLGGDSSKIVAAFSFFEMNVPEEHLQEDRKWMAGNYLVTEEEKDQLVEAMMHGLTSVDIAWLKELSNRRREQK